MNNWDSETHIFHADHYRRGWFDPWEEKWYGGFWVYSYPPLAHQLIAISSFPFGLEMGYRLVQGIALLVFPLVVWLLAREVVGRGSAGWAALFSTGVPGVYVVLYTFGQLPAFLALVFTLLAGAFLVRYLHSGGSLPLLGWLSFAGAAAATNHQTAFILMPVLASGLVLQAWAVSKRTFGFREFVGRVVLAALLVVLVLQVVLLPFWWWFFTQGVPQAEIPHPTRTNFFGDSRTARMFFWDMYGGILAVLPFALWVVVRQRGLWPLGIVIVLLGILGLGGLTLVPKLILGRLWKVLTYDRFPLWATVLSLIPLGLWMEILKRRGRRYLAIPLLLLLTLGVVRAIAFPLNRDDLLPQPLKRWEEVEIAKFLEDDEHSQWNYVTFGLGEAQLARLSRRTSAHTIDGFFNQARWREEQARSGVGTLDASAWVGERGYDILFSVLQRPWEWCLRWAVVGHPWVEQHLRNSGWSLLHPVGSDESFQQGDPVYSQVTIWEAPSEIPIPKVTPGQQLGPPGYRQVDPVEQVLPYMWGLLPLISLATGIAVVWKWVRRDLFHLVQ